MERYDEHRGVMNYLAIGPSYRGNSLGRLVVKEVERRHTKLGCQKVNLLVKSDNTDLGTFYKGINYRKQEEVFIFGKRLISDD